MKSSAGVRSIAALACIAALSAAHADWTFQAVNPPGAVFTEVYGLNNQGQVALNGPSADANGAFVYDVRSRQFTPIAPAAGYLGTALFGIAENGRIAGSVTDANFIESGFIRAKDGTYSVFSHPGSTFTEPRGINDKGIVVGYADTPEGLVTGFIHDPANGTFTDLIPSCFTVAQGINSQGEVVGSAIFVPPFCPSPDGSLAGRYGWFRSRSGNVTFFQVNGQSTAARGINEAGFITGYIGLPQNAEKGFVTTISAALGGSVAIADGDLLAVPGHLQTVPEGINDNGVVSGITSDNFAPGLPLFGGFVATPKK